MSKIVKIVLKIEMSELIIEVLWQIHGTGSIPSLFFFLKSVIDESPVLLLNVMQYNKNYYLCFQI